MPETIAMEGESRSLRVKIISMGAAESGKSCLIKRFCEKRFVSKYMATLGIDFGVSKMKIGDHNVRVNIFDMAGQPFFFEVRNEFYKDTQGALLVYDVTNRASFEALSDWLIEMRTHLAKPQDLDSVMFVVCANKTDLGRRKVDESEGRLWAETKGFHYFETSAQSNSNIQEAFETLVKSIVDMMTSKEPHPRGGGGRARLELGYTPEQATLVTRIRSCHSNYEILNVSRHCSRDEVNKAYKQLAVLLHPDKNLAPGSEEAFKTIARAREELLRTRE